MSDLHEEALFSTASLKERGLRPRTGETPAKVEIWKYRGREGSRQLWRIDQAVEIKSRALVPTALDKTPENVLLAVWSVNRASKRRRDAAESAYGNDLHGFAKAHKGSKEHYYDITDRGIAWLAHHGHLSAAYRHGQLVVWVGGGYSFHSTLSPHGAELAAAGDGWVRLEAKPRGLKELRLVDAMALLGSLPSVVANYNRVNGAMVATKADKAIV
jgi:hypothetical protein